MEQFQNIFENFPEVLQNARSINGSFYCLEGEKFKRILREMVSSNVKFEVLKLFEFGIWVLCPFVKDLDLVNTKLTQHVFLGCRDSIPILKNKYTALELFLYISFGAIEYHN